MKLFLSNCSELGHIKHVTKNGTKIIFPVKLGYCLKKKKKNEWMNCGVKNTTDFQDRKMSQGDKFL